jgi:hypothetical protein
MEYTKIKFSELPEGVGFWVFDHSVGDLSFERIIMDGECGYVNDRCFPFAQPNPNHTIYIRKEDSMSLEDKKSALAQAIKDQDKSNNVFDATIADLKQQIAEGEVTYSIGDRFRDCNERKIHMVQLDDDTVALILLSTGEPWSIRGRNYRAKDVYCITSTELNNLTDGSELTRYFDFQKKKLL